MTHLSNADNESGLTLAYSVNNGSWNTNYASIAADSTSYQYTDLQPGTYTYRISAYNAYGSNSSETVIVEIGEPVDKNTTIRLENTSEVHDAFLDSSNPDSNYDDTNYLGSFEHFILKFNLPTDLSEKKINSAKIAFYVWNLSNWQANQCLELYPVEKN